MTHSLSGFSAPLNTAENVKRLADNFQDPCGHLYLRHTSIGELTTIEHMREISLKYITSRNSVTYVLVKCSESIEILAEKK